MNFFYDLFLNKMIILVVAYNLGIVSHLAITFHPIFNELIFMFL